MTRRSQASSTASLAANGRPILRCDGEPPPGPPETTVPYVQQQTAHPEQPAPTPQPKQNWFQRLASGLKRSSDQLTSGITAVFTKKRLDQGMLDELEDLLIQSDFGIDMAEQIVAALRRDRFDRDITADEVKALLSDEVQQGADAGGAAARRRCQRRSRS